MTLAPSVSGYLQRPLSFRHPVPLLHQHPHRPFLLTLLIIGCWTSTLVASSVLVGSDSAVSRMTPPSGCQSGRQPSATASGSGCLHYLNGRHGTLFTPNFPAPFAVPFTCSWIINATGYEPDSFITLYLTQMYLTRGVRVS